MSRERDWITTTEAGRILGVTGPTVVEYIEEGLITAVRYGKGFHRIQEEDVRDFLRRSVVGAGTKLRKRDRLGSS